VLRWHAGWGLAVLQAALVLLLGVGAVPENLWAAFGFGLAPAVVIWMLLFADGERARDFMLLAWAVAGGMAASLSGGLSGPLAIWCAAPMAAAVVLGGRRRLAGGAALSLLAAVVAALAQADRLVAAPPQGAIGTGLAMIGVLSIAIGLAAALLMTEQGSARLLEARSRETERLREAVEAQPHLIVTLHGSGRVEGVYGAPERLGVSALRLTEGGLASIVDEADRAVLNAALGMAINDGDATLTVRRAGSEQIWLEIVLRRLSPMRLVAALRDATADHFRVVDLEHAAADAEAMNIGKSRFLANMSHELRTPLNAIMGFSDVMRQRIFGDLPSRYAEYAELIHDAGSHLLALINDVLDMSKIEAARYELSVERLDARDPIQAALRLMRLQADEAGVQLRGLLASEPLLLDADRRALKQIALNLISNALKFTPKGGLVTVSLHSLAGALELGVSDTGLGIAPEDLKRLGRPFEQAGDASQQARGAGLGLSLVRSFAELHGGDMVIESRLGEGTAVTVRLPMPLPRAASEPVPEAEAEAEEAAPSAKVIAFKPQR
jgi:cell cycle sensor histidine kinase DivJ